MVGPTWTVDPLDGTSNFAHGQPPYGVSIGHARDGVPLVGVIAAPTRGALAWAVRGRGAFIRRARRVSRLSVSTKMVPRAFLLDLAIDALVTNSPSLDVQLALEAGSTV